jgi:basic membrane protein A
MPRRAILYVSLLAVLILALGACAPAPTPGGAPAADSGAAAEAAGGEATEAAAAPGEASAGEPLKVIHFVNGVLGDKSFFDSAERGIQRAVQELGVEATTIEGGLDQTQWEAALVDAAANEEFDVMVVGTFQMVDYLQALAPQYPDKRFFLYDAPVDYTTGCCDNVYSIMYKQNEGSYLAGVYAAAMTTQEMEGMNPDAVIGSVGGQEIPVILDFMVGYEQGARATNPDVQIIRQFASSWNDPAKGKELAKAQYSQGADIIFQIAAGTGQGVFEAAVEDGKYAIGVDSDQALIIQDSDPQQAERILTSMMKNVDNSIFRGLQMHLEGTAPYGEVESLGIAEGGVGLARNEIYEAATPDEVKALVDAAEQAILNGEITVETAF